MPTKKKAVKKTVKKAVKKVAARKTVKSRVAPRRTVRSASLGTVDVGRLGAETVQVRVSRGATVSSVLREAGFELNGERVMVNGVASTQTSLVNTGDIVLVLTPKQAGAVTSN